MNHWEVAFLSWLTRVWKGKQTHVLSIYVPAIWGGRLNSCLYPTIPGRSEFRERNKWCIIVFVLNGLLCGPVHLAIIPAISFQGLKVHVYFQWDNHLMHSNSISEYIHSIWRYLLVQVKMVNVVNTPILAVNNSLYIICCRNTKMSKNNNIPAVISQYRYWSYTMDLLPLIDLLKSNLTKYHVFSWAQTSEGEVIVFIVYHLSIFISR